MDSFFNNLDRYWRKANQWFYRTADRALDEAYKAAVAIKTIEDEHFGGAKIEIPPEAIGNQVTTYFQNDLNKYLNIARIRLAEFQTSRTLTGNNYPQSPDTSQFDSDAIGRNVSDINRYTQDIEHEARVLEKLSFIDEILARYADTYYADTYIESGNANSRRSIDPSAPTEESSLLAFDKSNRNRIKIEPNVDATLLGSRPNNMSDRLKRANENVDNNRKALIDISLINTFRRIQQDLNPNADVQVLENYRFSQGKTRVALRFILLLILVPLLVHFISKIVIIGPAIDFYRTASHADVFLNVNLQTEAIEEMERFEKSLKFKQMVGVAPKLSSEQIEERIQDKAAEIKTNFYRKSSEAVKNWFADFLAVLSFGWLLTNSKKQIEVLKSFIDDLIAGLSDTAKAFIIILLTDTFVGFHSPHGWEVILESIARHLGIPENREFNSLFIATVPVLMDTVFKYWIFRYLTGQSPSAVATFRSMNE